MLPSEQGGGWGTVGREHSLECENRRLARAAKGLTLQGAPSTSLLRTYSVRTTIGPLGDRGEKEYLCSMISRRT